MTKKESWLLPEGIDELLPQQAVQLENLHRTLVDSMQSWGYQLVVPPLVEYLDSLLTGTAKSLELQTFKLTDQLSGRTLGVRADMTPQVARIASHKLGGHQGVLRLCYLGNVLRTLPKGQDGSRNPIQLGAEIYGHAGPESDVESIALMVELLNVTGAISNIALDVGHVNIFRGLAEYAQLTNEQEQELFSALQRKATADIKEVLADYALTEQQSNMFKALAELNGDSRVLQQAKSVLAAAPANVQQALDALLKISDMLAKRLPEIRVNFDLAELRGYDYHTGVVFAAYRLGSAEPIALGGRYDDIGAHFGCARPATGFSMDVKKLATLMPEAQSDNEVIGAEWQDDLSLHEAVRALRSEGRVVVYQLPNSTVNITHTLVKENGHWNVTATGTQTRG